MTWDALRHLHKEPRVIAVWLKVFGPVLRWLIPSRRRLLLALGALYIAWKYSLRTVGQAEDWPDESRHGSRVEREVHSALLLQPDRGRKISALHSHQLAWGGSEDCDLQHAMPFPRASGD